MNLVPAMGVHRNTPRHSTHPILREVSHYRLTVAYCSIVLLMLWVSEMVYAR